MGVASLQELHFTTCCSRFPEISIIPCEKMHKKSSLDDDQKISYLTNSASDNRGSTSDGCVSGWWHFIHWGRYGSARRYHLRITCIWLSICSRSYRSDFYKPDMKDQMSKLTLCYYLDLLTSKEACFLHSFFLAFDREVRDSLRLWQKPPGVSVKPTSPPPLSLLCVFLFSRGVSSSTSQTSSTNLKLSSQFQGVNKIRK